MAKSRSKHRGRRLAGVALAGTLVGGAIAARRSRQGSWASGEDPWGPEGLALPDGEHLSVETDDGARLDVLVAGPADGPLVALSHCWTGHKGFWAPVARRLVAGGHRVVLYDQRGHGASTLGRDPLRVERLGEDLRTVLVAVGANEVVLAGHSMGGMTVQALAVAHPDLVKQYVKGIVLVATAARVRMGVPIPDRLAQLIMGERASGLIAKRGTAVTRQALGAEPHRSHVEATHDAFVRTDGAVRAGCFAGMSHMDFRDGLASIEVPTTVMVGTHDLLTPPRFARVLADRIPGARLEVLERLGHMLPLEGPDQVAAAIEDRTAAR